MSVWQHATEYLMWSIKHFRLSADYADFTDRKIKEGQINQLSSLRCSLFSLLYLISVICAICGCHLVKTDSIDDTGEVTIRVLYFSI